MKNEENNQTLIKALELLPWYALGFLETPEIKFVEKALLEFPELQEHLKTEHEMLRYLQNNKELFSLSAIEDREERLGQLLQREEFQSQNPEKQEPSVNTKIIDIFKDLFSGQMNKSHYMGLAAVTTLSIALLFTLTVPRLEHKSTFYPAAIQAEEERLDKKTLLLGLNVEPGDPRLLKILNSYNVKTTTIAGKDGMYRLSFTKNKPNAEELKKLLSTLSTKTELIWFVGEAY